MLIDGSTVHYLLSRKFSDVSCDREGRRLKVDYPILYDETEDMSGHVVLVSDHERPHTGLYLRGSICVCMGEQSAGSARRAGYPVILVHDEVTFPHLYNYMQSMFVRFERLDAWLRALLVPPVRSLRRLPGKR